MRTSSCADVVLVVKRGVLHDHAADRHRLQLRDGRQRAGPPDLDIDALHARDGFLGGKLVRNRPARIARNEPEPLLPVEAIHLVDDAVDVVVERGALQADVADGRPAAPPRSWQTLINGFIESPTP